MLFKKIYFCYKNICQTVEHEYAPPGHEYPRVQGVFGHTAIVRLQSQVVVVGGYHGSVTGDTLGYTLPSTLATEHQLGTVRIGLFNVKI